MNAVFFYVPLDATRDKFGYFQQLAATLPFARRCFNRIILYTSRDAAIPAGLAIDTVVRMESTETDYPHFMRVLSWLEYLESPHFDADSVLLDADIVLQRRIEEAFATPFALAFSAMPSNKSYSCISGGVILARHERKPEAVAVMREIFQMAEQLKLMPDPRYPLMKTSGRWGLDELCLNRHLEQRLPQNGRNLRSFAEDIGFEEFQPMPGTPVALFGKKYNADARSVDRSDWHKPSLLHFGGPSKEWLYPYCEALENQGSAAPPSPAGDAHARSAGGGSLLAWAWRLLRGRG
jgi:hypothetical protein